MYARGMAEEIFIEPPIPDGDPQEQINALRAQLTMLQRTLDGMKRETIVDSSGRQFTVMAHRGPFVSDIGSAMAPYFEVKDGLLYGLVSPHAFLSANPSDIYMPVVPLLGGKKITDKPAPKAPLSEGKYHLILKTAGGRGILDFAKDDNPPKRANKQPNDWIVLARFTVEGTAVKDLELYHTVPQSQSLYAPQFTPLLWSDDGKTWQCETVDGYVWESKASAVGIKATYKGQVQSGDRLLIRIQTDAQNSPTSMTIVNQKESDPVLPLPPLEDQKAQAGVYFIEICTFEKIDEEGDTYALVPRIHHTGPITWHAVGFENVGDGEGKLLKSTLLPHTLQVKSIKNVGNGVKLVQPSKDKDYVGVRSIKSGYGGQATITEVGDSITVDGNGKNGSLTIFNCEGAQVAVIEWVDGYITTQGAQAIRAGCQSSSSDSSIP